MRIAFTFDDGPAEAFCASFPVRIHNALKQYGCCATFFYVAGKIKEENAAEIRRAYELGFEIGSHSVSHQDLTKLGQEEVIKEIRQADEKISKITGSPVTLFRAPYLAMDERTAALVPYPMISCSVDTKDYNHIPADEIIRIVQEEATDGCIVLMHEIYPDTAAAVEYLVPELTAKGHQIMSVSGLMSSFGKELKPGRTYSHSMSDPK